MAIRNIRVYPDSALEKPCKPVKEMTDKIRTLINDMFDTMYDADGVGLAAPQVGILKRIAVVDITEDHSDPIVMINPTILETSGEQRGFEGCLSVPEKAGIVTRPNYIKVRCLDSEMNEIEIEGEELLARALMELLLSFVEASSALQKRTVARRMLRKHISATCVTKHNVVATIFYSDLFSGECNWRRRHTISTRPSFFLPKVPTRLIVFDIRHRIFPPLFERRIPLFAFKRNLVCPFFVASTANKHYN